MVGEIMGTYGIGVSTLMDRYFLSSPRFISVVTRTVPLYLSYCGAWMRPGSWDLVIRLQACPSFGCLGPSSSFAFVKPQRGSATLEKGTWRGQTCFPGYRVGMWHAPRYASGSPATGQIGCEHSWHILPLVWRPLYRGPQQEHQVSTDQRNFSGGTCTVSVITVYCQVLSHETWLHGSRILTFLAPDTKWRL